MLIIPFIFLYDRSAWRHWGCTTPKILANMKKQFEAASELDGYEDLKAADQAKVDKAWEEGHVADEDIPASARKPEADGDGDGEGDEDGEAKPKKKKAPAKKKAKVSATSAVKSASALLFIVVALAEGRGCR